MAKNHVKRGLPAGPVVNILPPEFDTDIVSTFFADGEKSSSKKFAISSLDGTPGLDTAGTHLETARLVLDLKNPDLPDILGGQTTGCESSFGDELSGAGAKPSGKGGGGDAPGKGNGKGKDKTPIDPVPTPEPEPTPILEPEPTPERAPIPGPSNYVSGLDTPDGFNIEIVFNGTWTDTLKQGFVDAAEYFSDIITGDLPSFNGIDDIQITASLTAIDGAGGYWGWGGFSSLRADSLLPSTGYMQFDSADLDTIQSYGLWEDVVLHEMAHSLGFGTAWSVMGLIDNYIGDLRFNGSNAIEAYNGDYSEIAANDPLSAFGVPLETDGGSGTAGVHWDDTVFGNEMLTGHLNLNNEISDMSIAALEDMGYETVYGDEFLFV